MAASSGQLSVPPGFRFHPTDEELLYYYLRKKVSYEAIDLDVIREVDLNKLEPWDLKEKCRIGSGPQNEWYLFSHKDKKYPTGTRTNRATAAGFWKATGRDKAIHLMSNSNKRIGMRKTLVFYIGRAPHGQKTDWIMHEYRLDDNENAEFIQEDGWVVCRVFKKKSNTTSSRGFQIQPDHHHHHEVVLDHEEHLTTHNMIKAADGVSPWMEPKQQNSESRCDYSFMVDGSSSNNMHLPQLLSPESMSAVYHPHPHPPPPSFLSNGMDIESSCSQNLLSLMSGGSGGGLIGGQGQLLEEKFNNNNDWSFLDKLLASHQSSLDQQSKLYCNSLMSQAVAAAAHNHDVVPSSSAQKFPFPYHYLGSEPSGFSKFSKYS